MPVASIQLFDGVMRGVERVLDLRQAQHALVASNLANADTPGFKARHIDFTQSLQQVMDAAMQGQERLPGPEAFEIVELRPTSWQRDGNTVVAEKETVTLAENTLFYNTLTTAASRKLSILRFAASDGR